MKGPDSDSYPESIEDEELPDDCLVVGANRDHCDSSWLTEVDGDGEAGGDGGKAIPAQSAASTYS